MFDFNKPNIEITEISDDKRYGRFVVEPLERGYGTTLGNSLRRIMLSSLPGAAISQIKIDGVLHEFSSIPGVKEDVTEIVMNLKQVGFSDLSESTLYPLLLRLEQQGKVTVERRPSPKGPSRKYYVVTEEGRQALLEFRQDWSRLCQLVEKIFKEEPDE